MSATAVHRNTQAARADLVSAGRNLDNSQWAAFDHALTHQLSLIWGPPGTGKSRTLVSTLAGAVLDAQRSGSGLRILVTAFTYDAVDNVLLPLAQLLSTMASTCEVWRLRSGARERAVAPIQDCVVSERTSRRLSSQLQQPGADTVIVGATPQQLFNLSRHSGGVGAPLFDLIVVDEASQMDVASSILSLQSLAEGGSVIVAGDPLQLPPITQIAPPAELAPMVGSLYDFLRLHHGVSQQELLVNYRSNAEIVDATRDAGYPQNLRAFEPDLRDTFVTPIPTQCPPGWPKHLPWSHDLARVLDPQTPVVCVVHDDDHSGQANDDEANFVTSLAYLLGERLAPPHTGGQAPSGTPYTIEELLRSGVGVVTPHRAQQSKIISRLRTQWPNVDPGLIRKAVDTVEHFQGQQRDVIIGSYGVGDPASEDEFLQSLNRFNVMASRARAKLIVVVSREVIRHLSNDTEVLDGSVLLKTFADVRCSTISPITYPGGTAELRHP